MCVSALVDCAFVFSMTVVIVTTVKFPVLMTHMKDHMAFLEKVAPTVTFACYKLFTHFSYFTLGLSMAIM